MTDSGRFTHINDGFICEKCSRNVPPAETGCRNHCPFCLTSKHVDVFPGDRASSCHGLLVAVGYELDAKKGIVLIFKCERCGTKSRNKSLRQGQAPDDYGLIPFVDAGILVRRRPGTNTRRYEATSPLTSQ